MNRIRRGATLLGLALFAASTAAYAQETTGRITGRVVDQDSGAPLAGVTVIVQGAQGEQATISDEKGDYYITSLPAGTYTIRFYVANTSTQVEQPGVVVSAEKAVKVNARIASAAQAAAQQTYVITGRPPAVDIGSTTVGATFDETYTKNLPLGRTFGDILQKAPGAFVDPSGNVSIGGATGLENIYIVNGLNVTGLEFGMLESGQATLGGGTNLPLEFLTQIQVNSGGYQAEFGGAMGGVINTVLKSGTNELHGTVFGYWSPYWLSGDPKIIAPIGNALAGVRKPDFDTNIGAEVGGPIIKDKLFFWVGFAPRFQNSHVFRLTYAQQEAPMLDMMGQPVIDPQTGMPVGSGQPLLDAAGNPVVHELRDWRARINESRQTYSYAASFDWIPRPEHHLTLSILGTPNYNTQLHNIFNGADISGNPDWARERLVKTNTDVIARWSSKLLDRRWIIEANAGFHREDFDDRSPDAIRNQTNYLEIWGSNLWDLEHAPGCEPTASGFQPCAVNPAYRTGGFGTVRTFTGQRWMGELKSTNLIEAGGHHEIKYGWRLEYQTFDQDRFYSGPPGSRALVMLSPNGGAPVGLPDPYFNTFSFFTLRPGVFPTDFGSDPTMFRYPITDLLHPPYYQDHLAANVSSMTNGFFLQESFTPDALRNLTINVGARLELQKMNDTYGNPFLNTTNLGPRIGAIYDPLNDGRSKISAAYGRYFEAIPMNLAARYFGGEGLLIRNGVPLASCSNPNALTWTGQGEWKNCFVPPVGSFNDMAAGGTMTSNNGSDYPVQANLKGQYHNEIVATLERELMDDLTLRLDYTHRWLGTIIEDGTADPSGSFINVLANPGNVPQSAIDDAQKQVDTYQAQVKTLSDTAMQMMNTTGMVDAATQSQLANATSQLNNASAKLANLKGLAAAPKPERTYDAITITLAKRFNKHWLARGSYTYSRLIGNYEGLYQTEQNYFAPNGSNYVDAPDLILNSRGPLPNDRPHTGRLDGAYFIPVGKGQVTLGLSFTARSGMPRNYIAALIPGQQLQFLLPRGAGGRTPPVTQFDGRIGYGRPLTPTTNIEAFIDLFNVFNQQASILVDDNYTFQWAGSIVNGTPSDLKFAKDISGAPIVKQPNYGRAIAYQAPFNGRLGLRLTF